MGGICSSCTDPKGEQTKPGAISSAGKNDVLFEGVSMVDNNSSLTKDDKSNRVSQQQLYKEEQERLDELARLDVLVSQAARDMVSVRSTRVATYYHDQGFAAALSAHLKQTLPQQVWQPKLPQVATSTTPAQVLAVLGRPIPEKPEDRRWTECLLLLNQTTSESSTEQLFAKCPQIVESLL